MNLSFHRIALVALLLIQPLHAENPKAILPKKHLDILEYYCFDCHDSASEKGNVNLEDLSFEISQDIATAERWQKVLNAINSGEMPPKKKDQLTPDEKTAFLGDLSVQMVTARRVLADTGGVITLRRLNRREYENTMETLLGVRPDVTNLPPDQINPGFDTAGASLFFSSNQLEQYLAVARKTLEISLANQKSPPFKTTRIQPEDYYTPHYTAAAAAMRDIRDRSRAFLAQKEKPASAFGLLDRYQAKKQVTQEWLPQLDRYLAQPENKTGAALLMTIKQGGATKIKLPPLGERAEGKYLIRVRAAAYADAPERFHYLEFTTGHGSGRKRLGWRKVTASLDNPEIIEFPIDHRRGERLQIWIHQRTHQDRGDKNIATLNQKKNGLGTPPGIWVDWAELEGPVPVKSPGPTAQNILFGKPADFSKEQYAREVIHRFAKRAFRGTEVSTDYLDRLCQHYANNIAKGQKTTEALIGPLSIILSSPGFLYMVESTGNVNTTKLTDTELAVRLSYFLWSSPPDDSLLALAADGKLSDPKVLAEQTNRLLADERSFQFVRDFTYQWLEIGRLDTFQFNGLKFPTFDNAARDNAREEVFQTVRTVLSEKLPLGTLLKSDFVVINDLMAGYYGIPDVKGHQFRKVTLPPNHLRGGLLGSAAILAMGSDGERTSPVERGAWVLRHLINRPPPPAPPNVPMLSRFDDKVLPARELQRAHQEEPQCAQCHQKIDPIGFGLENFDADGLWRDNEIIKTNGAKGLKAAMRKGKSFPIDASGTLPGEVAFSDFFGLRDAVAQRQEEFAQSFAEALITYGLGRPFGFIDQDLSDAMLENARPGNFDMNLFIHALVQSKPFQTK